MCVRIKNGLGLRQNERCPNDEVPEHSGSGRVCRDISQDASLSLFKSPPFLARQMSVHSGSSPTSSPIGAKRPAETNMLAVPTKHTQRVSWTPYLRKYISNGYAEHPDLYTDDFRVLDELRNDCIYMDSSEKALNRLIKSVWPLVVANRVSIFSPPPGTMPSLPFSAPSFQLMYVDHVYLLLLLMHFYFKVGVEFPWQQAHKPDSGKNHRQHCI